MHMARLPTVYVVVAIVGEGVGIPGPMSGVINTHPSGMPTNPPEGTWNPPYPPILEGAWDQEYPWTEWQTLVKTLPPRNLVGGQ